MFGEKCNLSCLIIVFATFPVFYFYIHLQILIHKRWDKGDALRFQTSLQIFTCDYGFLTIIAIIVVGHLLISWNLIFYMDMSTFIHFVSVFGHYLLAYLQDIYIVKPLIEYAPGLAIKLLITQMQLEHRLSALLQLHLHSHHNTWLQWVGQRQLQDEKRTT